MFRLNRLRMSGNECTSAAAIDENQEMTDTNVRN